VVLTVSAVITVVDRAETLAARTVRAAVAPQGDTALGRCNRASFNYYEKRVRFGESKLQ